MTAQQLYNHLTKDQTPEQVLMRLLSYQIEDYEALKDMKDPEHPVNPIMIIAAASLDLGWQLAIEDGPGDAEVEGICVGTEAYLERIFKEKSKTNE
jgi:hypothetical protein